MDTKPPTPPNQISFEEAHGKTIKSIHADTDDCLVIFVDGTFSIITAQMDDYEEQCCWLDTDTEFDDHNWKQEQELEHFLPDSYIQQKQEWRERQLILFEERQQQADRKIYEQLKTRFEAANIQTPSE